MNNRVIILSLLVVFSITAFAEEKKEEKKPIEWLRWGIPTEKELEKKGVYLGKSAITFNVSYDNILKTTLGLNTIFGKVTSGFLYGVSGLCLDFKAGANGYGIDIGHCVYITGHSKSPFLNPIGAGGAYGLSFIRTFGPADHYKEPIRGIGAFAKICFLGGYVSLGVYTEQTGFKENRLYRIGYGFGF